MTIRSRTIISVCHDLLIVQHNDMFLTPGAILSKSFIQHHPVHSYLPGISQHSCMFMWLGIVFTGKSNPIYLVPWIIACSDVRFFQLRLASPSYQRRSPLKSHYPMQDHINVAWICLHPQHHPSIMNGVNIKEAGAESLNFQDARGKP